MKKRHELWRSSNAAEFVRRNSVMNIDLQELLGRLTTRPADAALVVCGSVAEGLANAESDVDLLLLLDDENAIAKGSGCDQSFSTGEVYKPMTVKFFPEGVEYDIEVCVLNKAFQLRETVNGLVDFLNAGSTGEGIPKLQVQDVRFIHQLRTGWGVVNDEVAAKWRSIFQTDLLPVYAMVTSYIDYMELLEDVVSAEAKGNHLDVANIGRVCAEFATLTLLAIGGQTNPNRKWMAHLLSDLGTAKRELRPLADMAIGLLFPAYPWTREDSLRYTVGLRTLGGHLHGIMERNERLKKMLDLLFAKLHYIM